MKNSQVSELSPEDMPLWLVQPRMHSQPKKTTTLKILEKKADNPSPTSPKNKKDCAYIVHIKTQTKD